MSIRGMTLHELDRHAARFGCRVVTTECIDGLARDNARAQREARELREQVAKLKAALRHEPWWRRRRA